MATSSFLRHTLRLAAITLLASAIVAGPVLPPAVSLTASASDPCASPYSDSGMIAYVKRSTGDIYLINPDGTNNRLFWTSPDSPNLPHDLAWRPDGGELAFSSEHEYTCSYYESDIYGIGPDGTGYRRITNAPACAALAGLPKGTVTVNVTSTAGQFSWVYVAGAPGIVQAGSGTMTFNNVADFGAGIGQAAIGIYVDPYYGEERTPATGDPPDVLPGQTVGGQSLNFYAGSGLLSYGAGEISWNADGSALAYAMRSYTAVNQLPATAPYGTQGTALPLVPNTLPDLVAMGPPGKENQYLYCSAYNTLCEGLEGIYWNTVGDPSGGTMLVDIDGYYSAQQIFDVEWLPDGSGFLYSLFEVGLGFYSYIYKYDFATGTSTPVIELPVDSDRARGLSISPDGQSVVFERTDDIDTAGSLWIANLDGSGMRQLVADAARPAWGLSGTLPPVAPAVSISLNGKNVTLSWTDNAANTGGYRVRYSEKPYFQPTDMGVTTINLPKGSTSWTHTNGAGDPAHNNYYLIQGVTSGGNESGPSNRTGGFNFGLTRGTG